MKVIKDTKNHLDELFGIENDEKTEEVEEETPSQEIIPADEHLPAVVEDEPTQGDLDIEYDYELSRETHKDLIEQGQGALTKLLKVAEESQHPRAYEVAGQLLKNLSDMTDKLIILQEKRKKLQDAEQAGSKTIGGVNVDKAVFIGTTSELLKELKHVKHETDK